MVKGDVKLAINLSMIDIASFMLDSIVHEQAFLMLSLQIAVGSTCASMALWSAT